MPTGFQRNDLYCGEQSARICALYSEGLTTDAIAEIIGCSGSTIRRVLIHLNVPRRPTGMIGRRHSDEAKKAVGDSNRRRVSGDWWITTDGYVTVYQPDHPNARHDGSVLQHRLVVEKILGRYLSENEIVHHINGIKHDNAEDNLELFKSSSLHSTHHAPTGRKLSDETRRKMSQAHRKENT